MSEEEKQLLKIIKLKDTEIQKLREEKNNILRKLKNRVKEVKKLYKYSLYKEEFKRLNKQLAEKDEMIDLMASYIWKYDCCDEIEKNYKCQGYYREEDCKNKCIKEYFKNGVKYYE